MSPRISILLVNYNNDQQIGRALNHIINQTMPPYEVIVCDDGSTDNSVAIIKEYCKKYNYINLHVNSVNKGIIYSFNTMVQLASGDFVLGSASDDLLLPNFVEKYTNIIKKYPAAKLIYSDTLSFDTNNSLEYYKKIASENNLKNRVSHNCNLIEVREPVQFASIFDHHYECISTNTAVMDKQALIEAGIYDEKLKWHCDWFSAYCIALRYQSVKINETISLYNYNDASSYSKNMNNAHKQIEVIHNILKKLNDEEFYDIQQIIADKPLLLSMFDPRHMLRVLTKYPRYYKYFIKSKIIFVKLPMTYVHIALFTIKNKTPSFYNIIKKSYRLMMGKT